MGIIPQSILGWKPPHHTSSRLADIKILPQSVGWFCFHVEIIEEGFFFLVFQRKEIVLNDAEYTSNHLSFKKPA
jgi:hypothetical protein